MALDQSLNTDSVPDLAVILGDPRTFREQPTMLVVEVCDTTLAYDHGEKSNLYATGGIADNWVMDVNGRRLFVFRDPQPDQTAPRGYAYSTRLTFDPGDAVSLLAAPMAAVAEADLLP